MSCEKGNIPNFISGKMEKNDVGFDALIGLKIITLMEIFTDYSAMHNVIKDFMSWGMGRTSGSS